MRVSPESRELCHGHCRPERQATMTKPSDGGHEVSKEREQFLLNQIECGRVWESKEDREGEK